MAPLREQDVLVVGSGISNHNLGAMFSESGAPAAASFDAWLDDGGQRSGFESTGAQFTYCLACTGGSTLRFASLHQRGPGRSECRS